ncbi:hypothetical protein E1A91_D02G234300v1 [Gossypium mustelinum]|uniref:Secreted protein n=3 Tax=Gossypium TaxID=3633 RepID=A0A5J5SGT0_GOSBA|nr:hypothetical protein ES319_D02G229500v1 [Gossypium barbadense]TYG80810.1 hypothetical protein ES288_D02G245900v1 [Gossypium darwinii]TYI94847.1 hypothetical protein E1A91_D02G234300v1 [Gossypium mustelinum]
MIHSTIRRFFLMIFLVSTMTQSLLHQHHLRQPHRRQLLRHQTFRLFLCCRCLPTRSQVLLCRRSRRLQEQLSYNGAVLNRDFGSGYPLLLV